MFFNRRHKLWIPRGGDMKASNGPKEGKHKKPKERLSCIIYGIFNVI